MEKAPKRYTKEELLKVGVELINQHTAHLKCMICGQVWSPNLLEGGKLPKGYWQCPNGCNS